MDWNRLIGSPDHRAAAQCTAARTSGHDAGNGYAIQNQGADIGPHAAQGPVAAVGGHNGHPADRLGDLCDRARVHGALVLGAPVSLPVAVLLAVRQRGVRAGVEQPGPVDPRGAADHPVRVRVAGVRARLPAELLLLPAGLLPGVLAVTTRLRGARAARCLQRRDQVPADHAEPAPLLLLPGDPDRDLADLRRGAGVPRPRRRLRARPGHTDHAAERGPDLGLHAVLSLVPAHHRRQAEALFPASGPILDLDADLEAERAAHAVRVGLARYADAGGPLHLAGVRRRLQRSADLQLRRVAA